MNAHLDYLLAGYGISVALFVAYAVWMGWKRRTLLEEESRLEQQGARVETEE